MKKIILTLGILFLLYFLFLGFKINRFYTKIYTPQKKIEPKTEFNFLLFGYGGGQHDGTYLTDTIIVFYLDIKAKKAVLISIPRDLWVPLPTKSGEKFSIKVNAVYQTELFPNTFPDVDQKNFGDKKDAAFFKYIVGQVIGQKIDYYVGIDFKGFKKAIDAIGGVEVNVEKSFVDFEYPVDGKEKDLCGQDELFKKAEKYLNHQATEEDLKELEKDTTLNEFVKNATEAPYLAFPCRYQKVEFKQGKVHMNGETALKFVRSRHSADDGNDFARARRQHLLLQSVKEKVVSLNLLTKIFPLLDTLGDHLRTDVSLDLIKQLMKEVDNINQYQLKTFILSTENLLTDSISQDGQYILIPKAGENDFSEIWEKIKEITIDIAPTINPSMPKRVD